MKKAADNLEFEEAAKIRDEIKRLEMLQLTTLEGAVDQINNSVIMGDNE